jgi:hypothetical protein
MSVILSEAIFIVASGYDDDNDSNLFEGLG